MFPRIIKYVTFQFRTNKSKLTKHTPRIPGIHARTKLNSSHTCRTPLLSILLSSPIYIYLPPYEISIVRLDIELRLHWNLSPPPPYIRSSGSAFGGRYSLQRFTWCLHPLARIAAVTMATYRHSSNVQNVGAFWESVHEPTWFSSISFVGKIDRRRVVTSE